MSSLAEINQRLIEQNNEQERTSVAIEDVRKALIAQMKTERRGRLDELEAAKKARPTGGFVSGVAQGIGEASGLGGLGRFFTGILGALFGGGTLAALTTAVGKFIGKGTFLGAAAALVTQFGEKALNSLFDELEKAGIDFGLSDAQQNDLAKRGSDIIFAALLTGIVTKNPLVRLATGIVYAFRDRIYDTLEDWFGIKITRFEDGSTQVSIPGIDKTFTPTENQLDLTLAGIATAVSLGVVKLSKSIISKLKSSFTKADGAATKAFKTIADDLAKIQADFEADRKSMKARLEAMEKAAADEAAKRKASEAFGDVEAQADKARLQAEADRASARASQGLDIESEVASRKTIDDYYKGYDNSMQARQAALEQQIRIKNEIATRNTLRRLQNINAQPLDVAPKVTTTAPKAPVTPADSPAVKATSELSKFSDAMIEEAGFSRKVSVKGRPLFFDNQGKFTSPNLVLDETQRIQAENQAKKAKRAKVTKTAVKGLIGADLAISGLSGAAEAVEAGDTTRGDISAGAIAGVTTAGLDFGAFGVNLIADATEGYLKAAQQYFGTYDPEKFQEGERLNFSLLREDIRDEVGGQLNKVGALGEEASNETKLAIIKSNDAVTNFFTKIGENIKGAFSAEEPVSPYASMSQADYLKLSSEGFSGSTAPGYSIPAPVIIQDNSVKSGGSSNSTTINSMSMAPESHDAAWYQRRAAIGKGF